MPRLQDLHVLPKFRDGLSFLYAEHCRVDREDRAIAIHDERGKVPVPCASLALLLLGPGVTITHAAVMTLADCGCLVAWTGEQGVRFYACGTGETRSADNVMHQALLWADASLHREVVYRLYRMRFGDPPSPDLSLEQLRGREGVRVREAYAAAARQSGIEWRGRNYDSGAWSKADPVNRALSAANSCLYGVCHAGIVSAGFSPALGFIHTGKALSFVYDVADLYKVDLSVPVAFSEAAAGDNDLERRVRRTMRDRMTESRLLERVVPDIQEALGLSSRVADREYEVVLDVDRDGALPGGLWNGSSKTCEGGVNHCRPAESADGRLDPGAGACRPAGGVDPLVP